MATPKECAMAIAARLTVFFVLAGLLHVGVAAEPQSFDVVVRGGTVYDGSGQAGKRADVGIRGDAIAAIGDLADAQGKTVIDASGKAVSPGFINMLSWATEALLHDGRSQSDIRQGVTLEIFGEGWSMGPLSETMKRRLKADQGELKYDVPWTTLAEYLQYLERKGVSCNVASFVGATTARIHVIGYEDRKPSKQELAKMKALVRAEMESGALGVGSSLIYAPAFYADTQELIELCKVAAEYDGVYISHIRSEGNRLEEAVDEFLEIVREAKIAGEIYHLKAAGEANWPKRTAVIEKLEAARASGLRVTADMYSYDAASTGLDAAMPPWVQEGGYSRWVQRLRDDATRQKVVKEMGTAHDKWENPLLLARSPGKGLLFDF